MANNRRSWSFLMLSLLICLDGLVAVAQTPMKRRSATEQEVTGETAPEEVSPEEAAARAKEQAALLLEVQALEGVLSDSEYVVGPGDVFAINILGSFETGYELPVTPGGELVIPTIGVVNVAGKTLAEVKEEVRELGAKRYRLGKVSAHLIRLRPIRVHVLGEVESPDTYVATTVDRVSRLIKMAGGFTPWADMSAVQIRHKSGSVDTLDHVHYQLSGELKKNIYVRDGDVIYVPPIELSEQVVRIEGLPEGSGYYRLRPHETVWDFLRRFSSNFRVLKPDDVRIIRREGSETRVFPVNLIGAANDDVLSGSSLLHDGDVIQIPSKKLYVYVSGAVQNPGPYPYTVGFQALDYVGLAGGIMQGGDVSEIETYHVDSGQRTKGPEEPVAPGDYVMVPELGRRVYVSGAVQNPGAFPYRDGFNALDYVGLAGGVAESANISAVKVYHIREGKWVKGPHESVEPGDFISVPELARKRWLDYLNITSGVASVISGMATIIIAAKAVGVIK